MNEKKELTQLSNRELWKLFPILLSAYNDKWPSWYEEERQVMIEELGFSKVLAIHHIGSTAVPGLLAKPTIDILLELADDVDLVEFKEHMKQMNYLFASQKGKPKPHMMFMKGYTLEGFEDKVFHVHVRYAGDWDELYFRDYLREHEDVRWEYAKLKQRHKATYEYDRDGYTNAKTEFVERATQLARAQYKSHHMKR